MLNQTKIFLVFLYTASIILLWSVFRYFWNLDLEELFIASVTGGILIGFLFLKLSGQASFHAAWSEPSKQLKRLVLCAAAIVFFATLVQAFLKINILVSYIIAAVFLSGFVFLYFYLRLNIANSYRMYSSRWDVLWMVFFYSLIIFSFGFLIFISIPFIKNNLAFNWDKIINFLEIIIWPAVVIFAAYYFRNPISYLFLSVKEFNFLGTKGSFRSATEVIEERAQQLYEKKLQEEDFKRRFAELEENKKSSAEEREKKYDALLKVAKDLFLEKVKIEDNFNKLKNQLKDKEQTARSLEEYIRELSNKNKHES